MRVLSRWSVAFVLSTGMVVSSCNTVAERNGSETKFLGGVEDDAAYPAAVLLATRATVGPQLGDTLCTGTFIGPRTMLTARHCFADMYRLIPGTNEVDMQDFAARGNEMWWSKTRWSPELEGVAVRIMIAPKLTTDYKAHDMAVVLFDGAVAPAVMGLYQQQPAIGAKFDMVGFGYDTPDRAGPKRRGSSSVTSIPPNGMVNVDLDARWYNNPDNPILTPGERPIGEHGDSGGPMIIGGKVAGVAVSVGVYAGVYKNLDLINAAKAAGFPIGTSVNPPPIVPTPTPTPTPDSDYLAGLRCEQNFNGLWRIASDETGEVINFGSSSAKCNAGLASIRATYDDLTQLSCAVRDTGPEGSPHYMYHLHTKDLKHVIEYDQKTHCHQAVKKAKRQGNDVIVCQSSGNKVYVVRDFATWDLFQGSMEECWNSL